MLLRNILLAVLVTGASAFAQPLVLKFSDQSSDHQKYFFNMSLADVSQTYPGARDFDGNGQNDLVGFERALGPTSFYYLVYGMPGHNLLWSSQSNAIFTSGLDAPPAFVDFDGDGQKEVMIPSSAGAGLKVFSPFLGYCVYEDDSADANCSAVLDYDGDNLPDLYVQKNYVSPLQYRYEIWGWVAGAPAPPTNLVVQSEGSDIMLSWESTPTDSVYNIQWCLTRDGCYATIGTSVTNNFVHVGASIIPRSFYQVTAIGASGETVVARAQRR